MEEKDKKKLSMTAAFRAIFGVIFVGAIVFIAAGSLFYWQGILYVGLTVGVLLASYLMMRKNPELINERLKPGKGMKSWDLAYYLISTPLFFVTIIVAALDTGRFFWGSQLPLVVNIFASVLYCAGNAIFFWARSTNNYFSSVVRIQTDRGQTVCQEGPYAFVRHPGYTGGLLFTTVTPLIFGSLWALIPTGITFVLMIVRTYLEDKTLTNELSGYAEYKTIVKYRLIPYIW